MSNILNHTDNTQQINNIHISPISLLGKLFQNYKNMIIFSFVIDIRLEFNKEVRKLGVLKGTEYTVFK